MKMLRYLALPLLVAGLFTTGCRTAKQAITEPQKSIVILFENDVHCNVDGYSKLAGLRDAVADTAYAAVVSSGDYLQGGTAGAISKGQYIVDVMRHVGYDALTLGNHEFDFKMQPMFNLLKQLGADVVNATLIDKTTGKRVFPPYVIKQYGKKKVAFLGTTTPTTLDTESYAFVDESGSAMAYDLLTDGVYEQVQRDVDSARAEGADYVVVLSHMGEDINDRNVDSRGLLRSTRGIDALLDGHTHSVIPSTSITNADGKQVLTAQTGTKFANIGKLLIMPNGNISISLIPIEDVTNVNQEVQHAIDSVAACAKVLTERKICDSDVDLRILNDEGKQQVRMGETNAGDLVADAFRWATGADLAMTNGGGIRTELKSGQLTYGEIVGMLPYDNYLYVIEVPGSTIMEVLRANTAYLPLEDGQFPQVSGMKYTVTVADHEVKDVMVLNSATGEYEPLDPNRMYTVATVDYCVTGGGMRNVLKDAKILKSDIMIYNEALVRYVQEVLGGHITSDYAAPQGRITVK